MKIELEMDREQIGIILTSLESMFWSSDDYRSISQIEQEIERWAGQIDDDGFGYSVVKIAPVYCALLNVAIKIGELQNRVYMAENEEDFMKALSEARAAVAHAATSSNATNSCAEGAAVS